MPIQRPPNEQEAAWYRSQGYDPSTITLTVPDPTEGLQQSDGSTAGGAFIRGALSSAVPTIAGGAGFAGGAALGAELGALGGPAAPVTVPTGALIGGLASGYLAGRGAGAIQNAVLPEAAKERLAADIQQHPVASELGQLSTLPLGGFNPSPTGVIKAAGALPKLALGTGPLAGRLSGLERSTLANVVGGSAIGGIQEAVSEKMQGQDLQPGRIIQQAGIGALFNRPNAIGRMYGFKVPSDVLGEQQLTSALQTGNLQRKPIAATGIPTSEPRQGYTLPDVQTTIAGLPVAQGGVREGRIPVLDDQGKPVLNSKGQPVYRNVKQAPKVLRGEVKSPEQELGAAEAEGLNVPVPEEVKNDVSMPVEQLTMAPHQYYQEASPLAEVVGDELRAKGLTAEPTEEYHNTLKKFVEETRNVNVNVDGSLSNKEGKPIAGLALLPEDVRQVVINPNKAGLDTLPHEAWHYYLTDLENSPRADDKAIVAQLYKLSEPGLVEHNARRQAAGLPPVDLHEFVVSQQGLEFVRRQLNLQSEGGFQKWKNDISAMFKQKYGGNATVEDMRRILNNRIVNDLPSRGNIGKIGPMGATAGQGGIGAGVPVEQKKQDLSDLTKTLPYSPDDLKRYLEIKKQMSDMSDEDVNNGKYMQLWQEFEKIRNKYNGNQPAQIQPGYRGQGESELQRQAGEGRRPAYPFTRQEVEKGARLETAFTRAATGRLLDAAEQELEKNLVPTEGGKFKLPETVELDLSKYPELNEAAAYLRPERQQESSELESKRLSAYLNPAAELVRNPDQLRLQPNSSGAFNGSQLLGTLKNKITPDEWSMLEKEGIVQKFQNKYVPQSEAAQWIDEHSPKVEVRKFKSGSNVIASIEDAERQMGGIQHRLDTIGRNYVEHTIGPTGSRYRFRGSPEQIPPVVQEEIIGLVKEYNSLSDRANLLDKTPREEQSHWQSIAPKSEQDMPGYVEIAVVKPLAKDFLVKKATGKDIDDPTSAQFPSTHSFPPNTLGFVRGYMETTKTGEKVFHVIEVQSDWAQEGKRRGIKSAKSPIDEYNQYLNEYTEGFHPLVRETVKNATTMFDDPAYRYDPQKMQVTSASPKEWYVQNRYELLKGLDKDRPLESPDEFFRKLAGRVEGDPLLSHYERLALKAAIEHARQEGAKKLAISDAETAMMTEGHDRLVNSYVEPTEKNINLAKSRLSEISKLSKIDGYRRVIEALTSGKRFGPTIFGDELKQSGFDVSESIAQEPGMRLHYDRTLPKIAEELTGSKGEKVSFGEHKMAFSEPKYKNGEYFVPDLKEEPKNYAGLIDKRVPNGNLRVSQGNGFEFQDYYGEWLPLEPRGMLRTAINKVVPIERTRQDLIFRNPDGTPKTDVSGLVFDITKVPERKPMLLGKRYQESSEIPKSPETEHATTRNLYKFLRVKPELDVFRQQTGIVGKPVADALATYFPTRDEYFGRYMAPIVKASKGMSPSDLQKVEGILIRENQEGAALKHLLNPKQQGLYDAIRASLLAKQNDQIKAGQQVTDWDSTGKPFVRPAQINPTYYPNRISPAVTDVLTENPHSLEAKKLKQDFISYQLKQGNSLESAKQKLDSIISSYDSTKSNSTRFGAVRITEGVGLPESWMKKGLLKNLSSYYNRVASDRAYYDTVESKPDIQQLLDPKNENGVAHAAKDIIDRIKGEPFEKDVSTIKAWNRLATAGMLGPLTNIHIGLSTVANSLQYLNPTEVPQAYTHAITNLHDSYNKALSNGYLRKDLNTVNDLMDNSATFLERLRTAASLVGRINGRQATDVMTKSFAQGMGDFIVRQRSVEANQGDTYAQQVMQHIDPSWKQGKTYTPQEYDKLASVFAGFIHGAHDPRTLPSWMNRETVIQPFFSLMSWSISQTNQWMKHVWEPATKGNLTPLLMSTLGAAIGGYTIQQLRQAVVDKKSAIPSVNEIAGSSRGLENNIPLLAYNFMQMASYTGWAGIASVLTKDAFDMAYKNIPQGSTFPLDEVFGNSVESVAQGVSAWLQRPEWENFFDIFPRVLADTARENIQGARIAMNWAADTGLSTENEQFRFGLSNKTGELRRWKMTEGMPYEAQTGVQNNPYFNVQAQKFKRTENVGEAIGEMPNLMRIALARSAGNPEIFGQQLESLKQNSYQTMPSVENMPYQMALYYKYLVRTYGKAAADARLQDYMRHNAINRIKSSMVPTIR